MSSTSKPAAGHVVGDTPLAVDVHLALVRAYEAAIHANVRFYTGWGLTAQQYNVLRILYFAEPGGVRLADIGERLLQRVPDVTRLVDRLVAAGFARRSPDPDDRRAVRVALTERGHGLLAEMDEPLMAAHVRWYAALTEAEQRQLESLLGKAAAAITSAGDDDKQDTARPTNSRRAIDPPKK